MIRSLINIIDFDVVGDERGSLVALEGNRNIPFDIKRVYYIYNAKKDVARGFHAHKKLQQVVICMSGKCRMILDDGKQRNDVWLDSPHKGLLIGNSIWREMHDFSADCVLVVLASEVYDEADYIRSYADFINQERE